MVRKKIEAREKIISSTIQFIKEHADISKITIREIANRSSVGIGLINYHFQTKENLINLCILRLVDEFVQELEGMYQSLEVSPIDKIKHVFNAKCSFIASNPGISKISMILDLNSDGIDDNTHLATQIHFKVLKDAFGVRKTDRELFIILHTLMASIQIAFLRSNVFRMHTGIDFFDKEQREKFIDNLVEDLLNK